MARPANSGINSRRAKNPKCDNCGKVLEKPKYPKYYLRQFSFCGVPCSRAYLKRKKIGYFANMSLK